MQPFDIKILSATHKRYSMPEDEMYIPLQVNCYANGHFDEPRFQYDDVGDNISAKNPYYCELTALYWGWKNLDCDYLGLVHYRRYLVGDKKPARNGKDVREKERPEGEKARSEDVRADRKLEMVLTGSQAQDLLDVLAKQGIYVVLPVKRNYYIETLFSHYAHSHHETDLLVTSRVIFEFFPEYAEAFTEVMKRHRSHMFNMCIMRKDLLDAYCTWLFDVLGKVEERLDISWYTDFDKRVYGRLSELLLDVWLTRNDIMYHELPMTNLEGENWLRKIPRFIRRKIIPEHRK